MDKGNFVKIIFGLNESNTKLSNAHDGCHVSNVIALFVYSLNLITTGAYVCHDRNIRGMVELKKRSRVILDIRSNIEGICVPFPNYHISVVCLSFFNL